MAASKLFSKGLKNAPDKTHPLRSRRCNQRLWTFLTTLGKHLRFLNQSNQLNIQPWFHQACQSELKNKDLWIKHPCGAALANHSWATVEQYSAGDIMTVVIEIDERAEISNATSRSRSGTENLGIPQLAGLPQRLDGELPEGASSSELVSVNSNSSSSGDGSVKRNEKLTLRVAATIVDVLPNGVLSISGSQELRVNFELRELLVTGYVRPEDISRQNEITYDKIASARVSYGGRGQITDVQQARIGQQVLDAVLPF